MVLAVARAPPSAPPPPPPPPPPPTLLLLLLISAPTVMLLVDVTRQVGVLVQPMTGPLQPVSLLFELSGVGPSLHWYSGPNTHENSLIVDSVELHLLYRPSDGHAPACVAYGECIGLW